MRIKRERQVWAENGVKQRIIGLADSFVRHFRVYGAADYSQDEFEFLRKALQPYLKTQMVIEDVSQLYTAVRWGLVLPEEQRKKIVVAERPRQIVQKRIPSIRLKPLLPVD